MPFDPSLKDKPEAFEHLQVLLEQLPHDYLLWYLPDYDDLGSLTMVYSAHEVAVTTGLSMIPFLGMQLRDSFPGLLETEMPYRYREALRTGEPQELPTLDYSDEILPYRSFRLVAYPVAPKLIGVLAEDVTARARAQAEREAAINELQSNSQELERSNRELEEFAYVASHDLKAPLRDIENLALWIAEDAAHLLPPKSAEHLQRLRDRVSRMQRLLTDLLEYSRAGRVAQRVHDVDVLEVLHNAKELCSVPQGFQIVLPDSAPILRCPKAPLEQVFINLMGNAIKHHGSSGGRVEVTWQDAGRFVEFTVSDDGPGIPPRFHDRVFRMFTTLKPRDQVEGSGMGLALVKKLVETYGGTITLVSDEGKGCTFRFTWPRSWSPKSAAQQ